MARLSGSPLGLINLKSLPVNGNSTFNGGSSRNVNVASYNKSGAGSLFTGKRILRAWPNIKQTKEGNYDSGGANDIDYQKIKNGDPSGNNYSIKTLHSNNIYDTSILNIIESLSGTKAALRPSDFAYMKDLGVYPNNRLMIARRFAGPVDDNIMNKKKTTDVGALATLISWQPPGTDFLTISFGEKWTDAAGDFKDILNRIGGDFTRAGTSTLGEKFVGSLGVIPLPTFTEIFQRQLLEYLGILEKLDDNYIPNGNPNLIKEAKRRALVPYESAGSGLSCTVEISMTCEWELKFISGLDPTIVWMDILSMIARFGTSPSVTYGSSKTFADKIAGWLNNPDKLVSDVIASITASLGTIKDQLVSAIGSIVDSLTTEKEEDPGTAKEKLEKGKKDIEAAGTGLSDLPSADEIAQSIIDIANTIAKGIALKYRVEIIGVMSALSGIASTPWHITIGNPMRPIFCSGDMLTQSVVVTLGSELAFNDLPSSIKATFALTNARPWGMQEIVSKFNSGYLRTVDVQKTYLETNQNDSMGMLPTDTFAKGDSATGASVSTVVDANAAIAEAMEKLKAQIDKNAAATKAVGGNMPIAAPNVAVADSTSVSTNIPPGLSTTSGQIASTKK